jgi:hypothetical protein
MEVERATSAVLSASSCWGREGTATRAGKAMLAGKPHTRNDRMTAAAHGVQGLQASVHDVGSGPALPLMGVDGALAAMLQQAVRLERAAVRSSRDIDR